MQMLADDARTRKSGHLRHSAALPVRPWQLDDHSAFARDRVLEDLSRFNRPDISRSRRIWVRHLPILSCRAFRFPHSGPASAPRMAAPPLVLPDNPATRARDASVAG